MEWELYLAFILVWGLGLLALVCLVVAFWSLSWPSVKGLIEVSFVDQESEWMTRSGDDTTTAYKKSTETHQMAYSYEVGGVKYLGANLKPWGGSGGGWTLRTGGTGEPDSGDIAWSGARDAASWYRPGAVVDVYYCPQRPGWSCVEPGGFIIPILLGGFSAFLYFAWLR